MTATTKIAATNVTAQELAEEQGGFCPMGDNERLIVECPTGYDAATITAADIMMDGAITVITETSIDEDDDALRAAYEAAWDAANARMTEHPTPMDIPAVAEAAGITRASVRQHRHRGTMPAPDGYIGQSPWWWPATIKQWLAERPGRGRPRTS